jgi:hypothetical protein
MNVRRPVIVLICVSFLKKKKRECRRQTWHVPRHLRDYCRITKVVYVCYCADRLSRAAIAKFNLVVIALCIHETALASASNTWT